MNGTAGVCRSPRGGGQIAERGVAVLKVHHDGVEARRGHEPSGGGTLEGEPGGEGGFTGGPPGADGIGGHEGRIVDVKAVRVR